MSGEQYTSFEKQHQKPPLGIRPKIVIQTERKLEILAAMMRYTEAYKQIPIEWINELDELNRQ